MKFITIEEIARWATEILAYFLFLAYKHLNFSPHCEVRGPASVLHLKHHENPELLSNEDAGFDGRMPVMESVCSAGDLTRKHIRTYPQSKTQKQACHSSHMTLLTEKHVSV